jgi:hypothetical protein
MSTLNEIQRDIALDFDASSAAPPTTNSEYIRRKYLIQRAVRRWVSALQGRWSVLFKSTTLTTVPTQTYVDMPADYNIALFPTTGYVKIGSSYYQIMNASTAQDITDNTKYVYVYGNKIQGFKLHISPTPTEAETIALEYYSNMYAVDSAGDDTENLSNDDDETKCPNHEYIVYDVLGFLYKSDDETNKGLDMERQARQMLFDMIAEENIGGINSAGEIPVVTDVEGYNFFNGEI